MNLRDLEYALAVAEHKTFTHAARAVAVSQPALSNQIKKLELSFGVDIFERGKDGVRPTEFGTELLTHARQILDLVSGIEHLTKQHKMRETATLRLGVTPTLAPYLWQYFKSIFGAIAPTHKVILVEEYPKALAAMVENRKVDMAFIARKSFDAIYRGSGPEMAFTSLWQEPLFLGVRCGHELSQLQGIWAENVPAEHLIRFDIPFGYELERLLPNATDAVAEAHGLDVSSARFETVCRYVAQSDTCTIVNGIAAEQFKSDGFGLCFIPFLDSGNLRDLGALTKPGALPAGFVDRLAGAIAEAPPKGTLAPLRQGTLQPV